MDLFANALKMAYGIESVYVVDVVGGKHTAPAAMVKTRVGDCKLSPRVEALYGSLKLPLELEGKSDDELKDEYFRLFAVS